MKITAKLWLAIFLLVVISPLGLILPEFFKAGPAWGEWQRSTLWNALLPDYGLRGWEEKGLSYSSFAYIISGLVGVAAVIAVIYLLSKLLIKRNEK